MKLQKIQRLFFSRGVKEGDPASVSEQTGSGGGGGAVACRNPGPTDSREASVTASLFTGVDSKVSGFADVIGPTVPPRRT